MAVTTKLSNAYTRFKEVMARETRIFLPVGIMAAVTVAYLSFSKPQLPEPKLPLPLAENIRCYDSGHKSVRLKEPLPNGGRAELMSDDHVNGRIIRIVPFGPYSEPYSATVTISETNSPASRPFQVLVENCQ